MSAVAEPKPSISGSFSHYPPELNNAANSHLTQDERRRVALREIDEAGFSIFHVKACLVAGIGFFTCAYDIFAIAIAETMIGFAYGKDGKLTTGQQLGIKVSTQIGILIGQLLFGWLADMVGRKKMYGFELIVVVIGTFVQALAGEGSAVNIIGVLAFWRFVMGVGIGADYPLSAVITSEFAPTRVRGRMMTAVFAMQGFGNFAAALVAYIVTEAFKSRILRHPSLDSIDYCWRLVIGLGTVPGCLALYFRLTIPETPRFTMDVERNVSQAAQDVNTFLTTGTYNINPDAAVHRAIAPTASWNDFRRHFGQWRNFKVLFGAAYAWFALDVAFYGLSLNTPTMLSPIGFGPELGHLGKIDQQAAYTTLRGRARGHLILSVAGLIPGYWATFFFIDSWGRKPIQLMGFGILTILFLCMGFGYDKMVGATASDAARRAFVFLYCLANFFQNFGPNTTTFIVPGEAFPTRYRATAHGISAASGKLGAIISQVGCAYLKGAGTNIDEREDDFTKHILKIFAFFMLTGLLATFLIEETKGLTLEELSNESQDGFISGGAGPLELQPEVVDPHHRMSLGVDEHTETTSRHQRVPAAA